MNFTKNNTLTIMHDSKSWNPKSLWAILFTAVFASYSFFWTFMEPLVYVFAPALESWSLTPLIFGVLMLMTVLAGIILQLYLSRQVQHSRVEWQEFKILLPTTGIHYSVKAPKHMNTGAFIGLFLKEIQSQAPFEPNLFSKTHTPYLTYPEDDTKLDVKKTLAQNGITNVTQLQIHGEPLFTSGVQKIPFLYVKPSTYSVGYLEQLPSSGVPLTSQTI